jgi:hypothetical protein
MKIGYILSATGSALLPRIDHAIQNDKEEWAVEQCETRVISLSRAGYYNFVLFEVGSGLNSVVKEYQVKEREPEVITINA